MTIYKEFKAEIAHKLSRSWTKKCQHIHGHSYRFGITIKGEKLNDEGVIVDFGFLKQELAELIDLWDHSFFIHDLDPLLKEPAFIEILKIQKQRLRICNFNPTAENMARYLLNFVDGFVKPYNGRKVERVEVWETASASATAIAGQGPSWEGMTITYLGEKL